MAKCVVSKTSQAMFHMRKSPLLLLLLLAVACSGGSSDGSGSVQGPTQHAGRWTLEAVITAVVAGTTFNINTTSQVDIRSNGAVGIITTDTDCALSIFVNGNTLTYEEACVFPGAAGEDSDNAACSLKMVSVATFVSAKSGSGTFGPKSLVCTGSAASYSGTLVAARNGAPPQ